MYFFLTRTQTQQTGCKTRPFNLGLITYLKHFLLRLYLEVSDYMKNMRALYEVLMSNSNLCAIKVERTMTSGHQGTKIDEWQCHHLPWDLGEVTSSSWKTWSLKPRTDNSTCLLGFYWELNKIMYIKYVTDVWQINSKVQKNDSYFTIVTSSPKILNLSISSDPENFSLCHWEVQFCHLS